MTMQRGPSSDPLVGAPARGQVPAEQSGAGAYGAAVAPGTRYARPPAVPGSPQVGPYPFMPPGTPEEIDESVVLFLERVQPVIEDTWASEIRYKLGFLENTPAPKRLAFYLSHEPWYVTGEGGTVADGPWLASLRAISAKETRRYEQDYMALLQERRRRAR